MTMNKTLLTAAVLGVVSAAISSAAFADGMDTSTYCKPGFYAGVQGGRSDTFYGAGKAFGPVAYDYNGSYANDGGLLTSVLTGTSVDDIGLGGRIYAGYQFNPYFAVETGYTQYAKTDFSGTSVVTNHTSNGPVAWGDVHYNGEITEHALDLVAKGTLPLAALPGFGVYAKAGMAYISADKHINTTGVTSDSTGAGTPTIMSTVYTASFQGVRPVAGVGVNYTIPNTNLSVDASYTRVFSYGAIPNASLSALGVEYKFA